MVDESKNNMSSEGTASEVHVLSSYSSSSARGDQFKPINKRGVKLFEGHIDLLRYVFLLFSVKQ